MSANDNTTDDSTDYDSIERVDNFSKGVKVAVDITRGTGTRDQEKWKISARGDTATEAMAQLDDVLTRIEDEYGDRGRAFDPDGEVDDEGETEGDVGDFELNEI